VSDCHGLRWTPSLGASFSRHRVSFCRSIVILDGFTCNRYILRTAQAVSSGVIAMGCCDGLQVSAFHSHATPCFVLSLISRSGWVHLESTCP
jgi:hypothetical protein